MRSSQVYETQADRLIELSYDPELAARDRDRYLKTARQFGRDANELHGLIKSRVQAQVEMTPVTNCIVGFSCECGQGCDQVQQVWPGAKPEPEPASAPAPVQNGVLEKHAGAEAVARRIEQGARDIVKGIDRVRVMHRDQILTQKLGGDTKAELELALGKGWLVADDQGQVRLGPVPVPASEVPARYAGKAAR